MRCAVAFLTLAMLLRGQTMAQIFIPPSATSCPNYPAVAKDLDSDTFERFCYIRRATGPHGTTADYTCASLEFTSFFFFDMGWTTYRRKVGSTTLTTNYMWYQLSNNKALAEFQAIGLPVDYSVQAIVFDNADGYCIIKCDALDGMTLNTCAVPTDVKICTYNRTASVAAVNTLTDMCGEKFAPTYQLAEVSQANC